MNEGQSMNESHWLLLGTCALSLYAVGQVWLVQLSSYPLWTYVGEQEFRTYHAAWWHSIWGVVLAPAALLIIGAALMLWWRAPGVPAWATWLGGALQAALLLGTAIWWGPLMARLETPSGGLSLERYQLLMTTHWIRVGIVSAYGLLLLWMLAQSAWRA
jgi:hypothetical protein